MQETNSLLGVEGLVRFEIDAATTCSAQVSRVQQPLLVERLSQMKERHARHIEQLNGLLAARGGTPQEIPLELEGSVTRDYRSIGSLIETGPALISVQVTEEALLEAYEAELEMAPAGPVRERLEALAGEVRAHVQWLGEAVSRPWDQSDEVGISS